MIGREDTHSDKVKRTGRRIWLVRHGCTAWNEQQRFCGRSDISLAREGLAQARWLADYLSAEKFDALYTSDLLRARETAELIAGSRAQSIRVRTMIGWREIDFGAWEGLTYAEIVARFPTQLGFFNDPEVHAPPAGESLTQLRQRVLTALEQTLADCETHGYGDIVLVSHAGPLRVVLSCVLAMPLARQWQLALDPGSLSALDLLPLRDQEVPLGTLSLLNMRRPLDVPSILSKDSK